MTLAVLIKEAEEEIVELSDEEEMEWIVKKTARTSDTSTEDGSAVLASPEKIDEKVIKQRG